MFVGLVLRLALVGSTESSASLDVPSTDFSFLAALRLLGLDGREQQQ